MLMPRLPMLTLSRIWSGRIFLGQTCLARSFTRLMHLLRDVPKSFASFFNNFCIYKRVDVFSGHNTGNGTSTPKPSGMLLTPKVQLTQKLKKNTFLFHYQKCLCRVWPNICLKLNFQKANRSPVPILQQPLQYGLN